MKQLEKIREERRNVTYKIETLEQEIHDEKRTMSQRKKDVDKLSKIESQKRASATKQMR